MLLTIEINVNSETVQNYSGCWNGSGDNAGPNC